MILTLTQPQDLHAFAVQEGLRRKGTDTCLWWTTELAQRQQVNVEAGGGREMCWNVTGEDLRLEPGAFDVIWFRRAEWPVITDALHPADRQFAEGEYHEFWLWLIDLLPKDVFWVNPLMAARRARSKLEQQRVARRAGLLLPETLYSNDPAAIRALAQKDGRLAYKPVRQQGPWLTEAGSAYLYTTVLAADQLPDDDVLQATPGIYQQFLEKDHELRVTVIGRHVFPARLDSQATDKGRVDWRQAVGEDMDVTVAELSPELEQGILRVMDEIGLVYGCFDFVVTPAGEHYFLEVNEAGQFLFVEAHTGVPMLDAFCELLLQARPDFDWDPSRATVDYRDMALELVDRKDAAVAKHLEPRAFIAGTEPGAEAST